MTSRRLGLPPRWAAALRGPLVLVVAGWFAAAAAFGFHAVTSRVLGPSAYGGLASLIAGLTIAAVVVSAVQIAVTQAAAVAPASPPEQMLGRFARFGIWLTVAGAVLALPIDRLLGVDDPVAVLLVGSWLGVACLGAASRGVLIGWRHWWPVGLSLASGAVARVVLAVALTPAFGIVGAMVATVLGEAVATVWAIVPACAPRPVAVPVGPVAEPVGPAPALHTRPMNAAAALTAQLGMWVLATMGAVLARRLLAPDSSGQFAAAVLLANAGLFASTALATALLPRFATDGGRRVLKLGLAASVAVGATVAVVLTALAPFAIRLLGGDGYTVSRSMFAGLAIAGAANGCLALLTQYFLARRHPGSLVVWGGIVAVTLAAYFTHPSELQLAWILAGVSIGTACFMGGLALRIASATRPATEAVPVLGVYDPACALSVVVPSYNGGTTLRVAVESVITELGRLDGTVELIVVIDGSTDGSSATLDALPPWVRVEILEENSGKGTALRHGFAVARGAAIGFIDGDTDIDPEILLRLHDAVTYRSVWAAVASKEVDGASVAVSRSRALLSTGYRTLVALLFRLDVRDTQCGAKVFDRTGLGRVLPHAREQRFALDVELLALGERMGVGRVVELPVAVHRADPHATTISAASALAMAVDTARVCLRLAQLPVESDEFHAARAPVAATVS